MRIAVLSCLLGLPLLAQSFEVTISEPVRNCPTMTYPVTVISGQRVSGLSSANFFVSEDQSPIGVTGVVEITPGYYAVTIESKSTSLRSQIRITVTAGNVTGSATRQVLSCALRLTCADLPRAVMGRPYTGQLVVFTPVGLHNPVIRMLTPTSELQVDSSTGALTGTLTTPGNFNFRVAITVNDPFSGPFTAEAACSIPVDFPPITVGDINPKSATACGPGFGLTAVGANLQPVRGAIGSFVIFGGALLTNTQVTDGSLITVPVPDTLIRQFREPFEMYVSTRAPGLNDIDSARRTFRLRQPPTFAPNFTQTSLVPASPVGVTPLNVDVLFLDPTTRLRVSVGSLTRLLAPRSAIGGRLVFDVPNELLAVGGSARLALVNADEANPDGIEYPQSCSANSFRMVTLGPPTPVISGLSPRTATACGPAFPLTIRGANLVANSPVSFDGATLTGARLVGDSGLQVSVPAEILGGGGRTVQVRVDGAASPEAFLVRPAPVITQLSASAFPLNGSAQTVMATGTGFVPGVTHVLLQGRQIVSNVEGPTQLSFTLPGEALRGRGTFPLIAANVDEANPLGLAPSGANCPEPVEIAVTESPAGISRLEPSSEIAARTSPLTVTITGTGFSSASTVLVNGVAQGGAKFLNSAALQFDLSPEQLASPGSLRIAVRNGDSLPSNPAVFQVLPVPVGRVSITETRSGQDTTLAVSTTERSSRPLRATFRLDFEPSADNINGPMPSPFFAANGESVLSLDASRTALARLGTVAGTVVVRMTALWVDGAELSVLPEPAPELRLAVPPSAPVIESARLIVTATGFDVEIRGFSTVRNLTGATIQAAGNTFTENLASRFETWFRDPANHPEGGAFHLRLSYPLANPGALTSAAVSLTNRIGTSNRVTIRP